MYVEKYCPPMSLFFLIDLPGSAPRVQRATGLDRADRRVEATLPATTNQSRERVVRLSHNHVTSSYRATAAGGSAASL
jgi:hypothetical protein